MSRYTQSFGGNMGRLSLVRQSGSSKKLDPRFEEMQMFYRDIFYRDLEPLPFQMKPNPAGKEWTLIMPSWATYELGIKTFAKQGIELWIRKEIILPTVIDYKFEARVPSRGAYAIALSPTSCGDLEFKRMSANQLFSQNILGITLLERMFLELWSAYKYTDHLDKQGLVTSCTGSRLLNGEVPVLRHYMKRLQLYCFPSSHATPKLLPRKVVPLS